MKTAMKMRTINTTTRKMLMKMKTTAMKTTVKFRITGIMMDTGTTKIGGKDNGGD